MAPCHRMIDQSTIRDVLHYDPSTGVFTWRKRPSNRVEVGSEAGCFNGRGYRRINIGGAKYLAHHLAWLYVHGKLPEVELDHINGDPADNRFANLREATRAQNGCNLRLSRANTSGHTGVGWDARRKKWYARIDAKRCGKHLGYFDKKEDAIAARRSAALRYFGEFARAA
jgi:hypothetical protein